MSKRRTGRALVGLTAAGALLLGACGSDDGGEEAQSAPVEGPTMDNSEATLVSYVEEFLEGSIDDRGTSTYSTLSAACQERWSQEDWMVNSEGWATAIERVVEVPIAELQVAEVDVQEIDDDSATVVVTWSDATGRVLEGFGTEPVEWVHENGGWRNTDCPSLAEALAG